MTAADRLAMRLMSSRGGKAVKQAGRLGASGHRSIRTQAPKPSESQSALFDRVRPEIQTGSLLHSAGVRRPTVMTNHMSPMQILGHGDTLNLMQHRGGIIPESAVQVDGTGWGSVTINIARLPTFSTREELDRHIDPDCATELPPDGAVYLAGKLIIRNPATATRQTRITLRYASSDLPTGVLGSSIEWQGQLGTGIRISNVSTPFAAISIDPHNIDGGIYAHQAASANITRSNWAGVAGDSAADIAPDRRVALYEIMLWRAATEADTTIRVLRTM